MINEKKAPGVNNRPLSGSMIPMNQPVQSKVRVFFMFFFRVSCKLCDEFSSDETQQDVMKGLLLYHPNVLH